MDLNAIARYKYLLELRLSVQERKVLVSIAREVANKRFFVAQIRSAPRIFQTNLLHAILGRLVKKGMLNKVGRAEYEFKDYALVDHIKSR